jgi:hypothetical protein
MRTSAWRRFLIVLLVGAMTALVQAQPADDGHDHVDDPTKPEEEQPIVYCPDCDAIPGEGDLNCHACGALLKSLLPTPKPSCPLCHREGAAGRSILRVDGTQLQIPPMAPDESGGAVSWREVHLGQEAQKRGGVGRRPPATSTAR